MIYVEPNAGVTPVVQFIEAAQGQLFINNYYLDDADVLRAISIDVQRGVKVLVVIAGNPYDLTENVEKEKAALVRVGAVVHIAPPQFEDHGGYHDFDHAKYAVARNGALIGTANWDFFAFTRNREYIYTTQSPTIIRALTTIFTADFNVDFAPNISLVAPDLVVSPGSEDSIVATIEQPGAIELETEELGTDRSVLRALESKGSAAEIIIPPDGAEPFIL
jgi:cardiolipin synthase